MPSLSTRPNITFSVHSSPTDFLSVAFEHLSRREERSNIILAPALEAQEKEQQTGSEASTGNNFWICIWTTRASPQSRATNWSLDFVFALNDNHFGGYPLFIWSGHPSCDLTPAFIEQRVRLAVVQLYKSIPSQRIFSAFAPSSLPCSDSVKLAEMEDLDQVATLCNGLARDSIYFTLQDDRSNTEALKLIRDRRIWVYRTRDTSGRVRIASMVCSSRSSQSVAAITKIYTAAEFRGRQFAKRLMHWVTQHLLQNEGKDTVVLYVSHGDPVERVCHQVGYTGLCGAPRPELVEDWLEIGFQVSPQARLSSLLQSNEQTSQNTIRGHW
ncbi:Acetyltransferase (GNAT) domain [Rhizoctonia solani]|uniref:Acetyltransferase (GNAT) domain n=1 Tax=Rhizoctonia solani TaxID=456999 RepID=A0A8H7ICI7_9AGAM|nr:Acetyltransferase (GNAT) domain [Rhizoctonia solani]